VLRVWSCAVRADRVSRSLAREAREPMSEALTRFACLHCRSCVRPSCCRCGRRRFGRLLRRRHERSGAAAVMRVVLEWASSLCWRALARRPSSPPNQPLALGGLYASRPLVFGGGVARDRGSNPPLDATFSGWVQLDPPCVPVDYRVPPNTSTGPSCRKLWVETDESLLRGPGPQLSRRLSSANRR
jgi:hypothetical protein